jgi:hypothetical protein
METSIQVSPELHAKLKASKERTGAETFEEVPTRLIDRSEGGVPSRFGAYPEMKPFAHRDESHAT